MTRLLTLLTLSLLAGCAPFQLEHPADFYALEDHRRAGYVTRATSADGVVLATREIANRQDATLAFWTVALRDRLRHDLGYALLDEEAIAAASGERGVQLRFGRDEQGEPYDYWVTLFVTEAGLFADSELFLIECGGKRDVFASRADALRAAIAGFEIR